jgi:hypothetical protein
MLCCALSELSQVLLVLLSASAATQFLRVFSIVAALRIQFAVVAQFLP